MEGGERQEGVWQVWGGSVDVDANVTTLIFSPGISAKQQSVSGFSSMPLQKQFRHSQRPPYPSYPLPVACSLQHEDQRNMASSAASVAAGLLSSMVKVNIADMVDPMVSASLNFEVSGGMRG